MTYSGKTSTIFLVDQLVRSFPSNNNLRIAFLGYHDLMATQEEWSLVTDGRNDQLINRPNFEKLIEIHGRSHDVDCSPTIASWIQLCYGERVTYDVFDFTHYEGSEITHDFNYSLPANFEEKYDIVLDIGTCEHIFNFPQALLNVLKMTKLNGRIYHVGPLAMLNHGFYSYNPTLFCDFYGDNGCIIEEIWIESMRFLDVNNRKRLCILNIPKHDRFDFYSSFSKTPQFACLEYCLHTVIIRQHKTEHVVYPIQQKYRDVEKWR